MKFEIAIDVENRKWLPNTEVVIWEIPIKHSEHGFILNMYLPAQIKLHAGESCKRLLQEGYYFEWDEIKQVS